MIAIRCYSIVFAAGLIFASAFAEDSQTRRVTDDDQLRSWLESSKLCDAQGGSTGFNAKPTIKNDFSTDTQSPKATGTADT